MNSTRLFFRVHSWLGLVSGAIMVVLALSGVYLVYRAELDRYFNPEIRIRPEATHPVSIDALARAAQASFPNYNVGYLMFPADRRAPFTAYLREMGPGGEVIRHQVYLDMGSGKVIGHRLSYHFLSDWMVRIHEGLWLPDFWGQPLVALSGIVLALLGITGLWVYRKKLWNAFRWKKTTQRIGRIHTHIGVWSSLFSVLIGITGTVLNYDSLPVMFRHAKPTPLQGVNWGFLDQIPSLDLLVWEAHRAFPEMESHYIYFPESGPNNREANVIKVAGRAPGAWALGSSSFVTFGIAPVPAVAAVYDARTASLGRKLFYMTNTLHYGDYWGNASKVPYVIFGLAVTFLAGSGLWIRLRQRRPSVAQAPAN